jgi:hypothetical protein
LNFGSGSIKNLASIEDPFFKASLTAEISHSLTARPDFQTLNLYPTYHEQVVIKEFPFFLIGADWHTGCAWATLVESFL